jgi:phosphinothricin acetyltransferase
MTSKDRANEVRPARTADAAEIARIYNHYIRQGGVTFDLTEYPVERIVKLLQRGKPDAWFVAGSEHALWGWASVREFSDRPGFRRSRETAIYLDPAAMGTGVGDLLQQHVEQHCVAAGIHHAMAKILADNERSIAFHKRYGYEVVGIQREIGWVNDRWVDLMILQKIF